jgi:hypothetical protein
MIEVALAAAAVAACPATPVHYGARTEAPSERAPWVVAGPGARRIVGVVYAYEEWLGDARVRGARGLVLYAGREAKIAWTPRRDWGTHLVVEGQRIDGRGSFRARYARALSPRFYPSGITVPSAGCWRLTLRTGGRRWSFVVEAIEPPSERRCDPTAVEQRPHPLDPFFQRWIAAHPLRTRITATFSVHLDGVEGAATYAGGRFPNGASTKVLWMLDSPTTYVARQRDLVIIGRRLDSAGEFKQTARENLTGGGLFPSHLLIPTAGCWLLTVRIGAIGGVVVLRALDP